MPNCFYYLSDCYLGFFVFFLEGRIESCATAYENYARRV